jgi:hypothetical protein
MPLYAFLHNLLNVLIQITNKMGLPKKCGKFPNVSSMREVWLNICQIRSRCGGVEFGVFIGK